MLKQESVFLKLLISLHVTPTRLNSSEKGLMFSKTTLLCFRLQWRGRGFPAAGDRRPGSAAADRGPPDDQHEHQTGTGSQDLCSHQRAEKPMRGKKTDREKEKVEGKQAIKNAEKWRKLKEKRTESFCGSEKQKLTPRMTEQSHKKRFVVIYEIINRGVALGDGNRGGLLKQEDTRVQKTFHLFWALWL